MGHLERFESNHQDVIIPDSICGKFSSRMVEKKPQLKLLLDKSDIKFYSDVDVSMPLMEEEDYFERRSLTFDDGEVEMKVSEIMSDDLINNGASEACNYLPENLQQEEGVQHIRYQSRYPMVH
jgi:hypothetical protein